MFCALSYSRYRRIDLQTPFRGQVVSVLVVGRGHTVLLHVLYLYTIANDLLLGFHFLIGISRSHEISFNDEDRAYIGTDQKWIDALGTLRDST